MEKYLAYIMDKEFGVTPTIDFDGTSYFLQFDDADKHQIILTNFEIINGYFYSIGLAYQIIDPEEDDVRQRQIDHKIIQIQETKSIARQPLVFASTSKIVNSADRALDYIATRLDRLSVNRDDYISKTQPSNLKMLVSQMEDLPVKLSFDDFDVALEFTLTSNSASCKLTSLAPNGYLTVIYQKPDNIYIEHKGVSSPIFPNHIFWDSFIGLFKDFFIAYGEYQPNINVAYSTAHGKKLTDLRKKYPDAKTYLRLSIAIQFDTIKALIVDGKIRVQGAPRYAGKIHDLGVNIHEFFRRMQNTHYIE